MDTLSACDTRCPHAVAGTGVHRQSQALAWVLRQIIEHSFTKGLVEEDDEGIVGGPSGEIEFSIGSELYTTLEAACDNAAQGRTTDIPEAISALKLSFLKAERAFDDCRIGVEDGEDVFYFEPIAARDKVRHLRDHFSDLCAEFLLPLIPEKGPDEMKMLNGSRQRRTGAVNGLVLDSPFDDIERHGSPLYPPLRSQVGALLRALSRALPEDFAPFSAPPRALFADLDRVGYYEVVKDPIDFGTILTALRAGPEGGYTFFHQVHDDVLRVFKNAKMFNAQGTEFFQAADRLEEAYMELFHHFTVKVYDRHASGACLHKLHTIKYRALNWDAKEQQRLRRREVLNRRLAEERAWQETLRNERITHRLDLIEMHMGRRVPFRGGF